MLEVEGLHVLVTGASSGLGAHFSRLLAGRGARVTMAARRLEALRRLAGDIGGSANPVRADVADAGSMPRLFDLAEKAFGPVDVLVNNAGTATQGRAEEMSEADWDSVMDVNLKGCWLAAAEAARRMKTAGRGGAIVNIASILGLRVAKGVVPYAVAKAGLIQMTKALALEWARHEIRVNAIAPGYVETDINRGFFATDAGQRMIRHIPQRRIGRMSDLDGPLLLLCSPSSSFMTGAVIPVDGGHLVQSL